MKEEILAFVKAKVNEDTIKKLIEVSGVETVDGLEDAQKAIAAIFAEANELTADGYDLSDVYKFLSSAVEELTMLAEKWGGDGTGEAKKAFVVAAGTALYIYVDRGPDGDQNRINIPWVPTGLEIMIEDRVVPLVLDLMIEGLVKLYNRLQK